MAAECKSKSQPTTYQLPTSYSKETLGYIHGYIYYVVSVCVFRTCGKFPGSGP